jgi:hypothetical protein
VGRPVRDFTGVDPSGKECDVQLSTRPGTSALLFLTSSCQPCRALWATAGWADPAGPPVMIVTPSPSTESRRRVAQLAPPSVPVVMSSDAWHAYGVTRAPWLALLDGGTIAGEGPAPADWSGVAASVAEVSGGRPAPPQPL